MVRSAKGWGFFLIALSCLLPFVQASGSSISRPVTSSGTIAYPSTFVYRGTNLGYPVLLPGYENYAPNAFQILQDLGINTISVNCGTEGDLLWNIRITPNWAQNLDSFLSLCDGYGIKVVFKTLGEAKYTTYFGIVPGENISLAKNDIDKLAGNNVLGKNFITDPRIAFWIIDNEPDFDNATLIAWEQEMGSYLMQKGANVAVCGSVRASHEDDSTWIPLVRDYSNFIVIHHYHLQIVQKAQNEGKDIFNTMYPIFKENIEVALSVRGDIPLSNIIFGEFGLLHGDVEFQGYRYNFSEETRGEYYRAVFQACKDTGIGGVFPFYLFDTLILAEGVVETYGAVALNGAYYYQNVTDQYKAFYLPN